MKIYSPHFQSQRPNCIDLLVPIDGVLTGRIARTVALTRKPKCVQQYKRLLRNP